MTVIGLGGGGMSEPDRLARLVRVAAVRFLAGGFFDVAFFGAPRFAAGDRAAPLDGRFFGVGFVADAGTGAGAGGVATGIGWAACCTGAATGAAGAGAAEADGAAVESFDPPSSPLMKGLAMHS